MSTQIHPAAARIAAETVLAITPKLNALDPSAPSDRAAMVAYRHPFAWEESAFVLTTTAEASYPVVPWPLPANGRGADGLWQRRIDKEKFLMSGPLYRFFAADHRRLDTFLKRAMTDAGVVEHAAYAEFRAGLLKHIGMEEKILLPAVQRLRGGKPLDMAAKLRLDHGALAALLVPTPTPTIVAALRAIIGMHNALEEGPGGLYECCERLVGAEAEALLAQLHAAPEVPVAPHADGPQVMDVVRRALTRAGYDNALLDERHDGRARPRQEAACKHRR